MGNQDRLLFVTVFFGFIFPFTEALVEEVRLAGGGRSDQGRVEVKVEGVWGTVCDDGWNHQDARVICRMLQMTGGVAYTNAYFGQGSGRILLDNVGCHGDEENLNLCVLGLPDVENPTCGHHEDAGVRCGLDPLEPAILNNVLAGRGADIRGFGGGDDGYVQPAPILPLTTNCVGGKQETIGSVRLVGSEENPTAGFVQVRDPSQGVMEWGYVCDDYWTLLNAKVVCAQLCFDANQAQPGWHKPKSMQSPVNPDIILDKVQCTGRESSLLQCSHLPFNVHDCSPTELAAVTCSGLPQSPQVPQAEVDCQADRMVVVFKKAQNPKLRKDAIVILDNQLTGCSPAIAEDVERIVVVLQYEHCSQLVQSAQGNLTYTSSVLVPISHTPSPSNGMSRVTEYKVNLECNLAAAYSASRRLPQVGQPVLPASGDAKLQITMTMYQDDTFTTPALGQGVVLAPGGWVNLGLELHTADERFVLIVTSCYAGPDLSDPTMPRQALLLDKCTQEETVSVYTISNTFWGLRFQPFSFDNYPDVTVECAAYACKTDSVTESCDRSCNAANNKYKTVVQPKQNRRKRTIHHEVRNHRRDPRGSKSANRTPKPLHRPKSGDHTPKPLHHRLRVKRDVIKQRVGANSVENSAEDKSYLPNSNPEVQRLEFREKRDVIKQRVGVNSVEKSSAEDMSYFLNSNPEAERVEFRAKRDVIKQRVSANSVEKSSAEDMSYFINSNLEVERPEFRAKRDVIKQRVGANSVEKSSAEDTSYFLNSNPEVEHPEFHAKRDVIKQRVGANSVEKSSAEDMSYFLNANPEAERLAFPAKQNVIKRRAGVNSVEKSSAEDLSYLQNSNPEIERPAFRKKRNIAKELDKVRLLKGSDSPESKTDHLMLHGKQDIAKSSEETGSLKEHLTKENHSQGLKTNRLMHRGKRDITKVWDKAGSLKKQFAKRNNLGLKTSRLIRRGKRDITKEGEAIAKEWDGVEVESMNPSHHMRRGKQDSAKDWDDQELLEHGRTKDGNYRFSPPFVRPILSSRREKRSTKRPSQSAVKKNEVNKKSMKIRSL